MRRKVYQKKLENERILAATSEGRAQLRAYIEGREESASPKVPSELEEALRMIHSLLLAGDAAEAQWVAEQFLSSSPNVNPNYNQPGGKPGELVIVHDASACTEAT
jgi:hypothetical protein